MKIVFIIIGIVATLFLLNLFFLEKEASTQHLTFEELETVSIKEAVELLDKEILDPDKVMAGIRSDEFEVIIEGESKIYSLENEGFYLSFAPYINQTHPCNNHNFTTCRGELANENFFVSVVSESGEIIYESEITTYENGFKGIWLPRNIEATIVIEYGNLTASAPIETFDGSATCLTTPLKLK